MGVWMWGAGAAMGWGSVRNTMRKSHNFAKIAPYTRSHIYVSVSRETSHALGAARARLSHPSPRRPGPRRRHGVDAPPPRPPPKGTKEAPCRTAAQKERQRLQGRAGGSEARHTRQGAGRSLGSPWGEREALRPRPPAPATPARPTPPGHARPPAEPPALWPGSHAHRPGAGPLAPETCCPKTAPWPHSLVADAAP